MINIYEVHNIYEDIQKTYGYQMLINRFDTWNGCVI